jgi:hypothetical protein
MCSEVAVPVSNVFKLLCYRIHNLDIASKVPVPVDCAELIESLVRDLREIQLMVAYTVSTPIDFHYLNIRLDSTAYQ